VASDPDAASADLIEELVHQFSDPFAFYRELIQNSIDAGSSRIEVTLRYQPGHGSELLTAEVADWGEGMNRHTIEEYLVTKFRSTKEGDLTKIGKFGIGFLSVFAPVPELVMVETGRDGEDWRVLFHPDRSYELLRCPEPVEGTRVVLYKAMPPAAYREFAARSAEAVRRWCRHSQADVAFAAGGEDGAPPGAPLPVREPLQADAPFQVESRDEHTWIVAGPARGRPPQVGFYNRGLTLFEVREELVPGVSFKAVSNLLEHTLTRDNVKRDDRFEQVVARVRELQRGPMRERLAAELRLAAEAPGRESDYLALLGHARSQLAEAELAFPAVGGAVDGLALRESARALGRVAVGEPDDAVVQALRRGGHPVLRAAPPAGEAVVAAVSQWLGVAVVPAASGFSVCQDGPSESAGAALEEALHGLLRGLGASTQGARLAGVHGEGGRRFAVRVAELGVAEEATRAAASPFTDGPPLLVLNRHHARVGDALRLATSHPRLAAYLCARRVALEHGALDEDSDRRLVEAALAP
jgi:hypothetical protein